MQPLNPNPRWVAAFLCLILTLPSPAYALRPELDHAGVEQALTPAAGAEENSFPGVRVRAFFKEFFATRNRQLRLQQFGRFVQELKDKPAEQGQLLSGMVWSSERREIAQLFEDAFVRPPVAGAKEAARGILRAVASSPEGSLALSTLIADLPIERSLPLHVTQSITRMAPKNGSDWTEEETLWILQGNARGLILNATAISEPRATLTESFSYSTIVTGYLSLQPHYPRLNDPLFIALAGWMATSVMMTQMPDFSHIEEQVPWLGRLNTMARRSVPGVYPMIREHMEKDVESSPNPIELYVRLWDWARIEWLYKQFHRLRDGEETQPALMHIAEEKALLERISRLKARWARVLEGREDPGQIRDLLVRIQQELSRPLGRPLDEDRLSDWLNLLRAGERDNLALAVSGYLELHRRSVLPEEVDTAPERILSILRAAGTAAGTEDRDPLKKVILAQTMAELDLQARGKLYEMRLKPTLSEVEDLLRSRSREYGVYGVSYRSKQRLWIGIGDGEEVVSDGLVWNVMDRHPEIRRRLEIHNHHFGPNFPSVTDFIVLENQIRTLSPRRRAARHFVYGPRTGRLIEYGIRKPNGRPFPKKIRLRVWGEQEYLMEDHLFGGTQKAHVSKARHAASVSSAWMERFNLWIARAENVGAGEILRVELEDPFGDWVRWRRDVTLASVLERAGLVRPAAGTEEEWEREADKVVQGMASMLDASIRKLPYGAAGLLREARIDILPAEEGEQAGYEVSAEVSRARDLKTGFYSNGYDCTDAANWIAQRLQAGFRGAGIPVDFFRVEVKRGRLPIYPTDFYVEARAGSKRWILSATPGLPTLGATVIGEGRAFLPEEGSVLNKQREKKINLHLPSMVTELVPAAWVPLDADTAAKISAGVLPDPKGERAVIFTYQVELIRVGNPSALGDLLLGAVLYVDLDRLRVVRDQLAAHPGWRSAALDILREPLGLDPILVYSDMKKEVDPQSLRAHPRFAAMERVFQQHQAVLYDLIAGLRSWPKEWDASPAAGTEALIPDVDEVDLQALIGLELEGLLFDIDETIWLGFPRDFAARFLAAELGVDVSEASEMERFRKFFLGASGLSWDALFERARQEGWPVPSGMTEADYYRRLNPVLKEEILRRGLVAPEYLNKGVLDLLGLSQSAGVRLAVATGADPDSRAWVIEQLNIRQFFDPGSIHGYGNKRASIQRQAEAWGVPPGKVALIGDSFNDVLDARQAGAIAVAYARTPEERDAFLRLPPERRPHLIINRDFSAAKEILKKLRVRGFSSGMEQARSLAWEWAAAIGLGIAALPGGQEASSVAGPSTVLQEKQPKLSKEQKAYQEAIRTPGYLKKIELLKTLGTAEALEDLWRLQEPMDPRAAFKTYEQWLVAKGAPAGYTEEDLRHLSGFLGAEGRYKEAAALLQNHLGKNDVLKKDPDQRKAVLKRLSEVHAALGDYSKILESKEDLWSMPLSALSDIKRVLDNRELPHPPLRPYLPSADMAHLRLNPKAPVYLYVNPKAVPKKEEKFFREMVEDASAGLRYVSGGRFGLELKGISFEAPETWRGKIEYPVDLVTAPKIQEQAGKAFVVLMGYPTSGGTHYNGRGILFLRDFPSGAAEENLKLARLVARGLGSEPLPLGLQKKGHLFRTEEAGVNLENSVGKDLYLGTSPAFRFKTGWPEVDWIPLKTGRIRDSLPKGSSAGAEEFTVGQRMNVLAEAMPGGQALAVQASVLGNRAGLEEFLSRLPQQAGLETIVLEGDDPADWGVALAGLEAERVVFLGEQGAGNLLRRILPEIPITVLSPGAGMEQVLLSLGMSSDLLGQINAAGVEQLLASEQSA